MTIAGLAPADAKFIDIQVAQVDKAPKGCLSCHQKFSADEDYSLPNLLKQKPGHPKITSDDINTCMGCHHKG